MAETMYTHERLYDLGRENYQRLRSYCLTLEKGGFWNEASRVLKQSGTQMLDIYVQSVLLSAAVYCGVAAGEQQEYIRNITDTNPLEIPAQGEIGQEAIQYGERTAKLPPVLIQLCGVYDQKQHTHMSAEFVDTLLNLLLCMGDLKSRKDQQFQKYFTIFYYQITTFVQSPTKDERYVARKLASPTISSQPDWMLEDEEQTQAVPSPRTIPASRGKTKSKKNKSSKKRSAASSQPTQDKDNGKLREQDKAQARVTVQNLATVQETDWEEKHRRVQEEQKRLAKEREIARKKRIEEEKRLEEERRLEEKRRQEEEERIAKEEFQKVKKRLQDREKAEREAQEQRINDLLAELNQLVGLESVKEEIHSLINLIKVRKMREKMKMPAMEMSYHMVFTGSPGTGKTTVARLVARIYRELGILSQGQLVETDRSRLVAGYVGQTAINVREIVEQAIGGVLFIDEAYALVSPDTANDFGSEAVDTLVKLMEDHRDNLVVIVAGYTQEMQVFLKSNSGLISRFNKFIAFEDYDNEQLLDILQVMVKGAGLIVEPEALAAVKERLEQMTREERKDFGNARGVRNIFEKMVMNQANRLVEIEEPTKEQLMTLTGADAV